MSEREKYKPGKAGGASVDKNGQDWTLVLVRELRHSPTLVWEALTDPVQLAEWAPFDVDRNLAAQGPITLTTVGMPQVAQGTVTRAEAPKLLEYDWGGKDLRWQLEPIAGGTRLTLWHHIDRGYVAWGAAGWHICFDVLERWLAGATLGRIVGPDAMAFDWQRLVGEYAAELDVAAPPWPGRGAQA